MNPPLFEQLALAFGCGEKEIQAAIILDTSIIYLPVLSVVTIFDIALAARLLAPMIGLSCLASPTTS